MADILDCLGKYVPPIDKIEYQDEDELKYILLGGDQVTVACVRGEQRMCPNSELNKLFRRCLSEYSHENDLNEMADILDCLGKYVTSIEKIEYQDKNELKYILLGGDQVTVACVRCTKNVPKL